MAVTGQTNPVYPPGLKVSFAVSAAVTAGNLVEITGDMTVGPAGAASRKAIGVALQTASAVGDVIGVQVFGFVMRLINSGGVTAGDEVGTAAAGAVVTVAAGAVADVVRSLVGVALETKTTGLPTRVLVGKS